jgi:hypothetical protein
VNPTQWAISLTGPDGQPVPFEIPQYLPPDEQAIIGNSSAQLTVAWNMLCDQPLGLYTLRVTDNANPANMATLGINVTTPRLQTIAAFPDATLPGSVVHLYFCNYTGYENQTILAGLYYQTSEMDGARAYNLAIQFPVVIGPNGWAFIEIQSLLNDPVRGYLVRDEDEAGELNGVGKFWLVAP